MTHELTMGEDGIIRLTFIGDVEKKDIEAYVEDLTPFLKAATEENPLRFLSFSGREGKFSSAARKTFAQINEDRRIGKVAILGGNRFNRVLTTIILKATGRNNIRFFGTEAEALAWLEK